MYHCLLPLQFLEQLHRLFEIAFAAFVKCLEFGFSGGGVDHLKKRRDGIQTIPDFVDDFIFVFFRIHTVLKTIQPEKIKMKRTHSIRSAGHSAAD